MEPTFTDPDIPRYTDIPLPGYRHLPFKNPHPFLDKDGHSYSEKMLPPDSFGPENWQQCKDYLYSIDLFNHGYWWEAHERLKHICISAGRESITGKFTQGLIQVSAALLKFYMEETGAAETLAELGIGNLQVGEPTYLGIDVATLVTKVRECLNPGGVKYPSIRLQGL